MYEKKKETAKPNKGLKYEVNVGGNELIVHLYLLFSRVFRHNAAVIRRRSSTTHGKRGALESLCRAGATFDASYSKTNFAFRSRSDIKKKKERKKEGSLCSLPSATSLCGRGLSINGGLFVLLRATTIPRDPSIRP